MKNNRKHIDDFFKEKLGSYSEVPPADAWSDLDKRLDTLVPQVPTSPFRWVGHIAMVSVIAVLSLSLIQKYGGNSEKAESISKEQSISKLESSNSSVTVSNSASNMATVAVPDMVTGDETANAAKDAGAAGGNIAQTTNARTLALGATEKGAQSNSGNKETGSNVSPAHNKQASSKGGKPANYAPYNNGLANVNGRLANPAAPNTYNSALNQNNVEEKVDEVLLNANVNQSVTKNNEFSTTTDPVDQLKQKTTGKKPTDIKNKLDVKKADAKKAHSKPDFARWDAGVKGGYERGFNKNVATKYVIAPYLQYNISKKASIMVQPSVKFANSPLRTIGTPQSYYIVNGDGNVVDNGSYKSIVIQGSGIDTTYNAKYRYTQSHDSIVKTNKVGGTYMEYELPVMFKYSINSKLAVYGGTNIVFSKTKGVTDHTYTKTGIVRTIDTMISGEVMASAPDINDVIKYNNGSPFSNYNGPLYPAPQDNRIRFGAIMGFSYEYSDRWLLDALIQQNPAPKDIRGGYNINAPLSATYFRISVGYKLTK